MTEPTPEVALTTLINLPGEVARRHDVAITLTVSPFADSDVEPTGGDDGDLPATGSYVPA